MKALMKKTIVTGLLLSIFSTHASAHGENKPGPNGGYIRMPGAFHTEIVPNGKHKIKVYLLDIEWKNPSVINSKLEISYFFKNKQST